MTVLDLDPELDWCNRHHLYFRGQSCPAPHDTTTTSGVRS